MSPANLACTHCGPWTDGRACRTCFDQLKGRVGQALDALGSRGYTPNCPVCGSFATRIARAFAILKADDFHAHVSAIHSVPPPPDRAAAIEEQVRKLIRRIWRAELLRPGQTVEGALDRALDEYREILDAARGGR